MNQKLYEAVESAAKMAQEEGEMSMASILYGVLGSYVIDDGREMAEEVCGFVKRMMVKYAPAPLFPSSIDVE